MLFTAITFFHNRYVPMIMLFQTWPYSKKQNESKNLDLNVKLKIVM